MPLWLQIIIVASTLAGLGFAAFGMWVGYQRNLAQVSDQTSELLETVGAQQKALEAAERRFQNLEAIVTSQVWDAVHDDDLTEDQKQHTLSQAQATLDIPAEDPTDPELVAQIARRLRT